MASEPVGLAQGGAVGAGGGEFAGAAELTALYPRSKPGGRVGFRSVPSDLNADFHAVISAL